MQKNFTKVVSLVTNIVAVLILTTASSFAQNLNITASVPYKVPSETPSITSPVAGFISSTRTVTLQGDCLYDEGHNNLIITINNIFAATTPCQPNNSYSTQLSLLSGNNLIDVRYIVPDGRQSANSTQLNVIYSPPTAPATGTTSSISGQPQNPPTNNTPTYIPPKISFSTPILNFQPNSESTLSLDVLEGQLPLKLKIIWGDGSEEAIEVVTIGQLNIKHTYQTNSTYGIKILVNDSQDNEYSYEIVATPGTNIDFEPTIPLVEKPRFWQEWPEYIDKFLPGLVVGIITSTFVVKMFQFSTLNVVKKSGTSIYRAKNAKSMYSAKHKQVTPKRRTTKSKA